MVCISFCFHPVNLVHVEVTCEPARDLLAGRSGISVGVVGILILLNGIGCEDEDQVLAEVSTFFAVDAFVIIDVFGLDDSGDILLGAFGEGLVRIAGAFDSFRAEVFVVIISVENLESIVINIGCGDAVFLLVDGDDLVIG